MAYGSGTRWTSNTASTATVRMTEGRSYRKGNAGASTDGRVLYSYATPIAFRTVDGIWVHSTHEVAGEGRRTYTSVGSYSPTTGRQLMYVTRTLSELGYQPTGELATLQWLHKHYNGVASTWGWAHEDTEFDLWRMGTSQRLHLNPRRRSRR